MAAPKLPGRDIWFILHQWIGIGSALFLIIAAATGSALAFRGTVDSWLNPGFYAASKGSIVMAPGALAARYEADHPAARVSLLPLTLRPGQAAVLSVTPRDPKASSLGYDQVFLDPADGRVLGQRATEAGWDPPRLMQGLYVLHCRLFAGAPGRWLMGIVSGLWAVSGLIGLYMTFPKRGPFWSKWASVWTIGRGTRLPRFLLDLHRASGLWLIVFVVIVGATGFLLSFYSEVTEPAALRLAPSRVAALNSDAAIPKADPRGRLIGYEEAAARAGVWAAARDPRLKPATAAYEAEENDYRVGFTHSGRREYSGFGPTYVYVNAATGALTYQDDPSRDSAGRQLIRVLYPLHSGQVFGWITRLLIFLLGIATVEMAVTGVWIWWKKETIKWKARAAAKAA